MSARTSQHHQERRTTQINGKRAISGLFQLAALLLILIFAILPIFWMVSTSLKPAIQTFAVPPVILFKPTLEHYRTIYQEGVVLKSLLNSLIVASCSTLLALALGTPAAYAMARFDFKGKSDVWFWIISNRFISPIVVALPFFLIAKSLHLLDKHVALILIYLTFNVPLVIWLSIDQFRSVPAEIDEAALVDGAHLGTIFFRICLPLALPSVVVSAILCFIFSWNEFLFALVLTRGAARTAPVEAANFMTGFGVRWGPMMATGTLIVLPVIIFAALVSKNLVRGLTMGAIK